LRASVFPVIKEIESVSRIRQSARIIRDSYKTVADEFGLTRENCPTYPSFIRSPELVKLKDEGLRYFGLFMGKEQVGFIAIEKGPDGSYFLAFLAVLFEHRHRGFGGGLVKFALDFTRANHGNMVTLRMMDEQRVLKDWYQQIGFKIKRVNNYMHIPFTVCLMEREVR